MVYEQYKQNDPKIFYLTSLSLISQDNVANKAGNLHSNYFRGPFTKKKVAQAYISRVSGDLTSMWLIGGSC